MNENKANQPSTSDEIDLGQLSRLLRSGFRSLFKGFLRIFVYLKRSFYWLIGLFVLGILIGFGLKQLSGSTLKLDVIVTPQFETKNYLLDVIAEIQSNIKAKDTAYFQSLGMDIAIIREEKFEVEITPLRLKADAGLKEEMAFLELLKDLENSGAIADILRSELQDKTTKDMRITFYFKDPKIGEEYSRKVMSYLNRNSYYGGLLRVYNENAKDRIQRNDTLIKQIDILIENYTERMLKEQGMSEGRLILENQEPLNIPSLFSLKNQLIQDSESKKLELERRENLITIINFGKPYQEEKAFFKKKLVFYPSLLLGVFFLISFLRFLNAKSSELL
jgi:hypothetical protein